MKYFIFPNTNGQKIIWSATAPTGKIGGFGLFPNDIWVNTTTNEAEVFDGTSFGREGETAAGVYKWAYDANDYVTLTITNSGSATFNHVSGGASGFVFVDPVAIGAFASADSGSGIALSATVTSAKRVYADDGGAKIAAGEVRASISRMLMATADTDQTDHTIEGSVSQLKFAANHTANGNLAGAVGYLEVAAGATLIGGRAAQASVAAAVWGRVDIPSTAVIGTAGIVSAFAASGNLGGTHTGKASFLHIPNPSAGVWDNFLTLGSASGCHAAGSLNGSGGADILCDAYLKCDVNGTAYYIPMYDTIKT